MADRMWEMVVGENNADDSGAGIYARLDEEGNTQIGYLTTGAARVVTIQGDLQFTDDSNFNASAEDRAQLANCEVVVYVVSKSGITAVGIDEMDETVLVGAESNLYVDRSDEFMFDEMEEMEDCYPRLADMLGIM